MDGTRFPIEHGTKSSLDSSTLPTSANLFGTEKYEENIIVYYINTNEIPGELSRENMLSSHVKRSLLLWLHNKLHPLQ